MDSSVREDQSIMSDWLYLAAMENKVGHFDKDCGDEYFMTKTGASNNNILQIAVRHGSWSFAREALERFPRLIWETNLDHNTPLHFAAQFAEDKLGKSFVEEVWDEMDFDTKTRLVRMQNLMGNTPLHVALIHKRIELAYFWFLRHPGLAEFVNASMEAPLHLAIKHFISEDAPCHDDKTGFWTRRLFLRALENRGRPRGIHNRERDFYMGDLISRLISEASHVTRWRDASGLTPLHRAASLPKAYSLEVVKYIMEGCPQSIEVCDSTGKNILHHLINRIRDIAHDKDLLCDTHAKCLVNCQDKEGNTVAHLAVINNDVDMLHVLHYWPANWELNNNEGLSPKDLLQRHHGLAQMAGRGKMPSKLCYLAENADAYAVAKFLNMPGSELKVQDYMGRNCYHKLFHVKQGHIIIPEYFFQFVHRLCDNPNEVDVGDNNGDTPTHILAQINLDDLMIHLATGPRDEPIPIHNDDIYPVHKPDYPDCFGSHYKKYTYDWLNLGKTEFLTELTDQWLRIDGRRPRCLKQNVKGNTALHEALIVKNYPVFRILAEYYYGDGSSYDEEEVAEHFLVNNCNETVLHLLLPVNPIPQVREDALENFIKHNTKDDHRLCNEDGLSLLVLAVRAGNMDFAAKLCSYCPRMTKCRNSRGQTFWHEFIDLPPIDQSFNFANSSFTDEAVCGLLATKDHDGKTPLHNAFERRRFDLAETFLGLSGKLNSNGAPIFQDHLLKIPDIDGITPADTLGQLPYIPPQFEEFIGRVSTMIGMRSIWGIPSTQMKEYVNTIGVIAALLTTITFTVAFTVPGGLDQEKGTPRLMQKLSFQIFIIFDIIAMCLSMMVLFCLLWIMATGNKSKALVLLDFSIILLQASFYATLVTFMTGLYATTDIVKLWVAIVALVLCSMLILLMQKWLVMKFIIPSWKIVLILFDKAIHSARKLRTKYKENYRLQRRSLGPVLPVSSS